MQLTFMIAAALKAHVTKLPCVALHMTKTDSGIIDLN